MLTYIFQSLAFIDFLNMKTFIIIILLYFINYVLDDNTFLI